MSSYEEPLIETLGFYPLVLIPFLFFFSLLLIVIYIGHIIGIAFFGLSSAFFLICSGAKIKVLRNEILIKRIMFGTSYWNFDEVRFKVGGRILAYGGMYGGWIMPLKWRECVQKVSVFRTEVTSKRTPNKIRPLIYLLAAPVILFVIGRVANYLNLFIPSSIWALFWALGAMLSVVTYLYSAPIRIKIGKFSREQSSIIIGLIIGLITFLSIFLIYEATKI